MTINWEIAEKAKELVKEIFGMYNSKINEKIDNAKFEVSKSSLSHFDEKDNVLYIHPKSINDLSNYVHELLHLVSTSKSFNKQYIGFRKIHTRKIGEDMFVKTSFGYALNEGATECYTREAIYGKYAKAPGDPTYNFCSSIYKNLEKILSTSVSRVLYANANTENFIKAVATNAHTNPDNVFKLIVNMDAFFDTNRFHSLYLMNPNSADAKYLLANCYTYLAIIMSDYQKSNGQKFDFWTDIDRFYLTQQEMEMFADVATKVDIDNFVNNSTASVKTYENFAMHILAEQYTKKICNLSILPDSIKSGEFYNFLMLSTELCNHNAISYDIKTKDEQAILTRKIYNPKFNALNIDQALAQNVCTMLSARYAIRANTTTSDYYMEKCLCDERFKNYMIQSDEDYYTALCDMVKNNQELQNSPQQNYDNQDKSL